MKKEKDSNWSPYLDQTHENQMKSQIRVVMSFLIVVLLFYMACSVVSCITPAYSKYVVSMTRAHYEFVEDVWKPSKEGK